MAVEFQSFSTQGICESRRQLHTPSSFARSSLLYVQEVGSLRSIRSHLSQRSHLDSYLFILVLSGSGKVSCGGITYDLTGGDCALIDCRSPYSHQSSEQDPWELMWVHFNGCTAPAYYGYFTKNVSCPVFHTEDVALFSTPILQLLETAAHKDKTAELQCSKLITDILTLCFTVPLKQELASQTGSLGKLQSVKEYIDSHYAEKLSLDELSEQFFLSKFHLSREFKRIYGITVGSYILAQRITYAKELLRFSDKSMEAIAAACGIMDTSYFNKVFKKSEGISPSQYRKRWAHRP